MTFKLNLNYLTIKTTPALRGGFNLKYLLNSNLN